MRQTQIRVLTMSMNEIMRNTLKLFFERHCANRYKLVSDDGDLLIADFDNYGHRDSLVSFIESHHELPIILLSFKQKHCFSRSNITVLKKPLELKSFVNALNSMLLLTSDLDHKGKVVDLDLPSSNQLNVLTQEIKEVTSVKHSSDVGDDSSSTLVAENISKQYAQLPYINSYADVDLDNPKELKKIFSCNDTSCGDGKFVCCSLKKMFNDKEKVTEQLTVGGLSTFVMSANKQTLKMTIRPSALKSIAKTPFTFSEVLAINKDWDYITYDEYRTSRILWELSLWSTQGKLPECSDLHSKVGLSRWPNLPKLLLIPHAVQISALWIQHPMSLKETVRYLSIPQCYVFSFFVATQAIGLSYYVSNDEPAQEVNTIDDKTKIHLGNILTYLRNKLDKDKMVS